MCSSDLIPTEIRAIYLYPAGCTSQAGDSGWFSLLDPESGIFPYSRKKSGCSGASPEKGSRIFPVLEFFGSLPGLLLRRGFPQLRIQPEGSAHLFTTKFRSDTKGRISLLSSFQPYAYRACILRPLQPEHPENRLSEKSAPLYYEHYLEDIDGAAVFFCKERLQVGFVDPCICGDGRNINVFQKCSSI